MKTLKTLLSALALVALTATSAMAQGQASITASANVITDVTLTAVNNLDFGTMTDGDADSGVDILLSGAESSLGKFFMDDVASGQAIILTLSAPTALSVSSPTFSNTTPSDLPLSLTATYSEVDGTPGGGTNDFSFTGNDGELAVTTGATDAYVYVGGTVGGSAGNYQGQYSGDITLSVYYD
ncbi:MULTISPECIES: DUF4402 domain-containing protein [Gracilimonas]|uniref:DUF4402 domain-containing protein n=1 Tax=Gracilimonas sediminicola TaxID=2952158 RepID=A0A9X2L0M7_9BACT|nr:DUF4402 domain-containing protein [Gracilimonas sediminicola]MCP9290089.1 DUF4402 domain-containing protein [Gracilimonas sediminicola]